MSVQDTIGKAIAAGLLAKARALGEQIVLYHRNNAAVTLYCIIPKKPGGMVGESDGLHLDDARTIVVLVPTGQTGFAVPTAEAEPVSPGDYYTRRGRDHQILEIELQDYGYTYQLKAVEKQRLDTGAIGSGG